MGERWLPQHDRALKDALADFASFADAAASINSQFGTRFTRNSALGRAHRNGWRSKLKKADGPSPRRGAKPRPAAKPKPAPRVFACEPVTGLRIADVVPLHLSLLDLGPEHCRWPFGDGPFSFCGCEAFEGGPYCEPHAALSVGAGTISERLAHRAAA